MERPKPRLARFTEETLLQLGHGVFIADLDAPDAALTVIVGPCYGAFAVVAAGREEAQALAQRFAFPGNVTSGALIVISCGRPVVEALGWAGLRELVDAADAVILVRSGKDIVWSRLLNNRFAVVDQDVAGDEVFATLGRLSICNRADAPRDPARQYAAVPA